MELSIVSLRARLIQWRDEPDTLRRALRESHPGQVVVCAGLATLVGGMVVALHHTVQALHELMYNLTPGERLSSATDISPVHALLVPLLGGAAMGILALVRQVIKAREVIDPIEANAILGGRMSVLTSARLVFESTVSNMFGASIGMEAAYTQLGAALYSFAGRFLHLRREDMRIFVAAGASAAVAAAFHAPLAGAFYGFELILGAYTVGAISQVAIGALVGTLVARLFTGDSLLFALPMADTTGMPDWFYGLFVLQGIAGAGIAILTMQAVTKCEHLATRFSLPEWLRPIIAGGLIGGIALAFPQVLGSGQGAILTHLHASWPLLLVLALLFAKIAASVLSVSLGFRGGLFFTSLFIGCLFGEAFGLIVGHFLPEGLEYPELFMLVGIGAVGASIVGAPVTIVLLVLEMTGSLTATTSVLMGVLVASAMTRYLFGYSFSTWRFHVRGLRISGAHDIGWVGEITVRQLMREDCPTVRATTPMPEIRAMLEIKRPKRLFVVAGDGQYLGMVDTARIAKPGEAVPEVEESIGSLAVHPEAFLLPRQDIRQALELFRSMEVEELPVLEGDSRQVIGYLSESYALRRYAAELETRNATPFGVASPP